MARYITKERAYDLASDWGSYMHTGDPGACFYAFRFNDGRPVSEEHRLQCLIYARTLLRLCLSAREADEVMKLIRFLANSPLYPA